MFKTACVNCDLGLLTTAVPAIVPEPELAFDPQTRSYPEWYGVYWHSSPPDKQETTAGDGPMINRILPISADALLIEAQGERPSWVLTGACSSGHGISPTFNTSPVRVIPSR